MSDIEMEVSKPLDQIIAEERKKRRSARGGGRGGRGKGRGGRGSARGRGASRKGGASGGALGGRKENFRDRSIQKNRGDRTKQRWAHDKFQSTGNSNSSNRRAGSDKPLAISTGTKVLVSQLHLSISADDLREIFVRIGAVKKIEVQYDQSGTSQGTAIVTFSRKSDALAACKDYDEAVVDGKPMKLQLISSVSEPTSGSQSSSPRSRNNPNNNGVGRGGGRSGRGGRGGRRGGGRSQGGARSGGKSEFAAGASNPLLRTEDDTSGGGSAKMNTTFGARRGNKGGGRNQKGKGSLFGSALRDATSGRRNTSKKSQVSDETRRQMLDQDMDSYHGQ